MLGKQAGRRRAHLTETFQSSVQEEASNKFHMDRTLYKGIKDNDVSKIIDISRESGAEDDKLLPNQVQELQEMVKDMRKRYDEVRTKTKRLQSELQKQRKQAEALQQEQNHLKQHISSVKSDLQAKQSQQGKVNQLVEARVYDLDIYLELQQRLKHDILILRKRNFDKDYALKKDNIHLRTLKQEEFNKTKISYRCRDMLQSVEKTVVGKQVERSGKINSLYQALGRKQDNIRKREERQREIEQVMVRAMSQKLQEEKECLNILASNLFLKKFLKAKMEKLIKENQYVQTAYHQIRSNTDVRDSRELIQRFLNREKDYGVLLETIAQKQNFLEDLKADREILQKENHSLLQESQELHEHAGVQSAQFAPLQKKIDQLEEELKDIKYKKDLMRKWALRFHCAFTGCTKEQAATKYQGKPINKLISDVLGEVNKYTENLVGDENSSHSINQAFLSTKPSLKVFNEEMMIRNNRVKTATVEDPADIDDRDAFYDGASEADYLQHNRRAVKKNEQSRRFRIKTQAK